MFNALLSGFGLSISLIAAIGAQNAFVIRQGILGQHVLTVVLTCAISDALLISAGVAGFGAVIELIPWIDPVMRYGGAVFLVIYGFRALLSAIRSTGALEVSREGVAGLGAAIGTTLMLTWLNPHVYLDTVVLLGSVSTGYAPDQIWFALGAVAASFCFFFGIGFGAGLVRPLFAKPIAWRVMDGCVALIMFAIALGLVLSA